jgi:Uma2 family endonuclease
LLQVRLGRVLDELVAPRGLTVSAEFNLGKPDDYRIPDLGVHRGVPDQLYVPTAAMIVEILSPNDKTFEKFDFYGRHDVEEILVADLADRSIRVWRYDGSSSGYLRGDDSAILATSCDDLKAQISWP